MKLPVIIQKHVIEAVDSFEPHVVYGSMVQIGQTVAKGNYYKVLQEIPLASVERILVDAGVFVVKGTPLAESVGFLRKKQWIADVDGIVNITNYSIQIVDVVEDYEYTSPVAGRVTLATRDKIVIEASFYRLDLFASEGSIAQGYLEFLDPSRKLVTTQLIPSHLGGKILLINGMLTYQIVMKALKANALGIVGTSIEWQEYQRLGHLGKKINIGVLQGFGQFFMLDSFKAILKYYNAGYIEVDFAQEYLLLPAKEIVWAPEKVYIFSGRRWGVPLEKKSKELQVLEQEEFIV